jgi:NAD(P)-dependent dehydrogenase (short-subunit alcohol dehydrogenase family)
LNLIAAGFVDTPLSAAILGDQLDARREQLRTTLPIRRVVGPADIAALAIHLMTNTTVTGATSTSMGASSSSRSKGVEDGENGERGHECRMKSTFIAEASWAAQRWRSPRDGSAS